MLLSTVPVSEDNKRVSISKDVEAVRCRVNSGVLSSSLDWTTTHTILQ